MWLTSSSIGRKFVMAITGICLVLFVTFHVLMNSVAIVWPTAYNTICHFLGANWYALVASVGLAALFVIHIIYAVWLTVQNRAARGADRYAVNTRPAQVEWASKNMLVLGIVVLAFLGVHLVQFWARMQLQEILGTEYVHDNVAYNPSFGTLFLQAAFKVIWVPIVYIIGFIALWFHMNHGFWSMFHSVGWDNNIWINRLKAIGCWWTTIVVALFIVQVGVFTWRASEDYYTKNISLQEQYAETYNTAAQDLIDSINSQLASRNNQMGATEEVLMNNMDKIGAIVKAYRAICPDVTSNAVLPLMNVYDQFAPQMLLQEEMNKKSEQSETTVEVEEEEIETNY